MAKKTFGVLVFAAAALVGTAQEKDRFVPVKAPYAQSLVRKTANAHPELVFLGLHVMPPGKNDNVIIACTDESKIGKVSSTADMEVCHWQSDRSPLQPSEERLRSGSVVQRRRRQHTRNDRISLHRHANEERGGSFLACDVYPRGLTE